MKKFNKWFNQLFTSFMKYKKQLDSKPKKEFLKGIMLIMYNITIDIVVALSLITIFIIKIL